MPMYKANKVTNQGVVASQEFEMPDDESAEDEVYVDCLELARKDQEVYWVELIKLHSGE